MGLGCESGARCWPQSRTGWLGLEELWPITGCQPDSSAFSSKLSGPQRKGVFLNAVGTTITEIMTVRPMRTWPQSWHIQDCSRHQQGTREANNGLSHASSVSCPWRARSRIRTLVRAAPRSELVQACLTARAARHRGKAWREGYGTQGGQDVAGCACHNSRGKGHWISPILENSHPIVVFLEWVRCESYR